MKMFTKLALVSSMAISANAMAMQAMDDAALSSATGQDGINIGIGAGLNGDLATFMGSDPATTKGILVTDLYVHDNGGLSNTATFNGVNLGGTDTSGAIHIAGLGLQATAGADNFDGSASTNLINLSIDTDAGTAGAGGAFLNVGANVAALRVKVGAISVGASGLTNGATATTGPTLNNTVADVRRGTTGTENEILTGLTLDMGKVAANVQLGATPQGAMVLVKSSLSGLDITDLGIKDAASGGQIYLDGIHVRGAGGTPIDVDLGIKVKSTGLEITNNSVAGNDIYVKGVHLGAQANASIGDVEVQGLKLGQTTITISGH
ncbi:putative pilus system protein FilA [Acinetobacter sp. HC8-3S]